MRNDAGFSLPIIIFAVVSIGFFSFIFNFRDELGEKITTTFGTQNSEKMQELLAESINEPVVTPLSFKHEDDPSLLRSSFTDLFSGDGWINSKKTDLTQDLSATAFSFAPDITWEKIPNAKIEKINPFEPVCINGVCAEVRGENLFFKDALFSLPEELMYAGRLITVGKIGNRFVVSATIPKENRYKGYVFFFDGKTFSPVCKTGEIFSSDYKGEISAGGTSENFIVIYGGYEGKGVQILKNNCIDISGYLGIRPMSGGFPPRIIQANNDWYIWSAKQGIPRLLKLIGDAKTGAIVGAFDFVSLTFPSGVLSVFFQDEKEYSFPVILRGQVTLGDNTIEAWQLTDRGFHIQKTAIIISQNINTNSSAKVHRATITNTFLSLGDSSVELFLSNNEKEWVAAKIGEEVIFPDEEGQNLFWKAIFDIKKDAVVPPFFSQINIEYKIKPL